MIQGGHRGHRCHRFFDQSAPDLVEILPCFFP